MTMLIPFLTIAFLALIQSMTEFLPISSSGHLVLSEKLGFSNQSLATDVALHAGTLIAVVIYFRRDIFRLCRGFLTNKQDTRTVFNLIIATLPALLVGFFCGSIIVRFRTPVIIAVSSIFFGILLWIIDKVIKPRHDIKQMNWAEALCIGAAQTLALIPGTSRSGITITCCRAFGFNRQDSAKFSMLLSIPVIAAATVYVLWECWQAHTLNQFVGSQMLIGIGLAALFGLLVIHFLMNWLKHASFAIFAAYRVFLGILILYIFF